MGARAAAARARAGRRAAHAAAALSTSERRAQRRKAALRRARHHRRRPCVYLSPCRGASDSAAPRRCCRAILEGAQQQRRRVRARVLRTGPVAGASCAAAGFRVEVLAGRAPAPGAPLARDGRAPGADHPPPAPRSDPQLVGENAALRLACGGARGHAQARRLVAAGDPVAQGLARSRGHAAAGDSGRLLLDRRPRTRSNDCSRRVARSSSAPARRCPAQSRSARRWSSPRACRSSVSSGVCSRGRGRTGCSSAQALLRERGQSIHTVIVGGDSWDLSPEYAASLPPLIARARARRCGDDDRRGARRGSVHRAAGRPRQRVGPGAVRHRPARGDGAGGRRRGRRLRRARRVHRGRSHGRARALGRAGGARRLRSSCCSTTPRCASASAAPGARASCATSPTPRCGSASSRACGGC